MEGHAAVVRALLRAGASMGLRDIQGETALQCAQRYEQTACVAEFRDHLKQLATERQPQASGSASSRP